jgi:phosphoribosylformimino-5-aminoimidazole carboxamide ribotide isomerase
VQVIPAVDIRGGRCVRLTQGDYASETVFEDDPVLAARRWADLGATRIHVVDLDGARDGKQANASIVRAIAQAVSCPVQTGGGVRNLETFQGAIEGGLDRVAVGTAAVKDPEFLRRAVETAREQLIVSVDARDGRVSLEGWTEGTDLDALAFIGELEQLGVQRIVYTDISRDGVVGSPNFEMYEQRSAKVSLAVVAAGGVSRVDDVRRLAGCGAEAVIIGRALYTGDVDLREALEVAAAC